MRQTRPRSLSRTRSNNQRSCSIQSLSDYYNKQIKNLLVAVALQDSQKQRLDQQVIDQLLQKERTPEEQARLRQLQREFLVNAKNRAIWLILGMAHRDQRFENMKWRKPQMFGELCLRQARAREAMVCAHNFFTSEGTARDYDKFNRQLTKIQRRYHMID